MKKYVVILFLLCSLFITGCTVKKVEEVTDAEKFAIEYNIEKDNPFLYLTTKEMLEFVENGTGIIYFGFPECTGCQETISILSNILKKKEIKKIYYYNPKKIQTQNTESYQKLIQLLEEKQKDVDDLETFSLPDIYVFDKGKMIAHDNTLGTIEENVEDYLTEEKKWDLERELSDLISKVKSG